MRLHHFHHSPSIDFVALTAGSLLVVAFAAAIAVELMR